MALWEPEISHSLTSHTKISRQGFLDNVSLIFFPSESYSQVFLAAAVTMLFCIVYLHTLYLWICAVATAMLRGHFGSNLSADMLHQNRRSPGRSINMFDFVLKGANASQLEKDIGSDLFPANEHFFGLVNVSIILYFGIFL